VNRDSSTALFKFIFDLSAQPTAVFNSQEEVVAVNQAFENRAAAPAAALSALRFSDIFLENGEPVSLDGIEHEWIGVLSLSSRADTELNVSIHRFGQSPGEGSDNSGLHYVVRLSEIGTEAGADLVIDDRKKKLQQLGTYTSSIAHDLNNVLTGVLGHVSFLKLSLNRTPAELESLTAIDYGARRAAGMSQQILEYARGTPLEVSTVNLSFIVAAVVNLLRTSIRPNIEVQTHGCDEDYYIYGDDGQLNQLVVNLAVNARDALPGGGTIQISIERVTFDQSNSLGLTAGRYAMLSIIDNGTGIPTELREKIFEPFFTTKSNHGTGLGLSTVVSVVQSLGGSIRVESEEGVGTRFDVFLPMSDEERVADEAPEEEGEIPFGTEKILVVDDEESVRMVMQRCLEHLGYSVCVARDGIEALESYREKPDEYQLVILDMIMPQMAGDEVFRKLKELDASVGVLIASGYSSDGKTRAVLEQGGLGYIQKPFAVEDLARAVRKCLDRKLELQRNAVSK
jgi:two-component system cell cycle sensor histidine kinase/response regulator CckA